jgi:DNA adenine methylase
VLPGNDHAAICGRDRPSLSADLLHLRPQNRVNLNAILKFNLRNARLKDAPVRVMLPLRPVVRWAGGKSTMVSKLASLLPRNWRTYIEPMSGGAALFFHIKPSDAILADINSELITFYSVLRDRPAELIHRMRLLIASRERYYAVRASRPRADLNRALRFAYLNRLAWNGLYRVNRSGQFNVPVGDRLPAVMWSPTALSDASEALRGARLVTQDFRATARQAKSGDFVFFDPPYPRGSREELGFNRYASQFFSTNDHRDLARIIDELSSRSVHVMLTLAETDHFADIYPSRLRKTRVESKALIACNGADRRSAAELILTNY